MLCMTSAGIAHARAPGQSDPVPGIAESGTVTTVPDVELGTPTSVTRVDEGPADVDVAGRTVERDDDGGDLRWALLAIPVALGAWLTLTVVTRRRAHQSA